MRKILGLLIALAVPLLTFGQFGVSFHQSNLPFASLHYEIKEKFRPEVRIGTDQYFEALSPEGVINYDFLNKADYEVYVGAGIRIGSFYGLVIPIGVNFYPFERKNFGFHIELASILGEDAVLRGSWGIRYKFRKSE